MLNLKNVSKNYFLGDEAIPALREVSIAFRQSEFVSILGPSGCGKTTLLNIIGGLDKYTSGDLLVDGKSTSEFTDREWDSYRNGAIGFVFQNYNLISHFNVLDNVAIALSLSGVSTKERNERAKKALEEVGLLDQIHKKPNQLSGGQMQRVAIARALVNNPKILLADEPTGALDSQTSVQIMELILKISKDRLVIMVTHNGELAINYSDRIVRLLDGEVIEDSNPYNGTMEKSISELTSVNNDENSDVQQAEIADEISPSLTLSAVRVDTRSKNSDKQNKKNVKAENKKIKMQTKKTSMSFMTALKSSFKNLTTKKARTILTAVAGSIGIVGVSLVLALSSGMKLFISSMQSDTLAGFPISISKTVSKLLLNPEQLMDSMMGGSNVALFPSDGIIHSYDRLQNAGMHENHFVDGYLEYISKMDATLYNSISFNRAVKLNMVTKNSVKEYQRVASDSFSELPNSIDFVKSQYEIIGEGRYPTKANEIILIVDSQNRIDTKTLNDLGYEVEDDYRISDFVGRSFKVVDNDDFYEKKSGGDTEGLFSPGTNYYKMYTSANSIEVEIVGVMRVKENASTEFLSSGIAYTTMLTDMLLANASDSELVLAQKENTKKNLLSGKQFTLSDTHKSAMQQIGGDSTPVGIQIYPKSFETKDDIKAYLDAYNSGKEEKNKILYLDTADIISSMMTKYIDIVSIVLVAFAAISLLVSSIMIGIITYVSVVERTKEIGIMRAIGARKKDISRIFNAETIIIGFVAGAIGVLVSVVLCFPISAIASSLVGMSFTVSLPVLSAIVLVVLSMALTFIAGLIPARIASKKDPVIALRSE